MMEALMVGRGARRLSAREEELLGLLAGFPDGGECDSDRELSFSDLVEAGGASRPSAGADHAPPEDRAVAALSSSSPGRRETAASAAVASKQQRQQQVARQRARRSDGGSSRGSCGGSGDGVLLNFYVPGLRLTRSMTAPRPGRGPPSPRAGQGAPPKAAVAAAGKPSRTHSPLGIGCWPALWGRGRDRRPPAKACS